MRVCTVQLVRYFWFGLICSEVSPHFNQVYTIMLDRIMKNTSHQVMGEDTVSDLCKIFNGIGADVEMVL